MKYKKCGRCQTNKETTEFYKSSLTTSGFRSYCKKCCYSASRIWREKNIDKVRDFMRIYQREYMKKTNYKYFKKWVRENKKHFMLMHRAHSAVAKALRVGKINKEPCVVCGNRKSQAHHEDYARKLEVIWLCSIHHKLMD